MNDATITFINDITTLLTSYRDQNDFLNNLVNSISKFTGFNSVGIRKADKYSNINFEAFNGFTKEFFEEEMVLSLHEGNCLCMQAVTGKFSSSAENNTTSYGSFYINDFKTFVEQSTEEERNHYRGACLHEGFQSLAIVPLKTRNMITGTLNLAHPEKNKITTSIVRTLENLAPLMGETLYRFMIEEELQRNNDIQRVLNQLLRISIENIPLKQILEKSLDLLISLPWLSFQKKAAIFLVDRKGETLRLAAHKNYEDNELRACEQIHAGECLCGIAWEEKKIIYSPTLDHRHTIRFDNMKNHGDYCVPILHDNTAIGIINIQLAENHRQDPQEKNFLESVASTLSGIIQLHDYMEQIEIGRERYRALITQSTEGIFLFDPETLQIVEANPMFMEMLGYADEDIPSLLLTHIISAPRKEILKNVQKVTHEKNLTLDRREYVHRDGSVLNVSVNSSAIKIHGKTLIMVNIHDISEKIQSEKLEKQYNQLRDSLIRGARLLTGKLKEREALQETVRLAKELVTADYGVIAITDNSRIVDIIQLGFSDEQIKKIGRIPKVSGTYSVILNEGKGMVFDDVTSSPLFQGFPEGHPEIASLVGTPIRFKENLFGMLLLGNRPGKHVFTDYDREIIEGLAAHAAVVVHNARIYEMLQSFNKRLEEKVQEQTTELREAKVAAETANSAKTTFLTNMSHELRTPLNAIIGFADVLKEQYPGTLNDEQVEYTGYILDGAKHLLDLINDILDISKVEAGKMELEPSNITVHKLIETGTFLIREKMLKQGINFTIDVTAETGNTEIRVDVRKMKQVIFNLLSNAAKYTGDGGYIDINAYIENGHLYLTFRDNGIGIDPENLEKVFDEFYQVNNPEVGVNKQRGTGLGLSLSRKFVALHNGELRAESDGKGKGSTFLISLPLDHITTTGVTDHD